METDQTAWIATPITEAIVRGAAELEQTARGVKPHRLPARALAQSGDAQLGAVESQGAGVRLVFRTRATEIELAVFPTRRHYAGVPARPPGRYDLLVDGKLARQCTADGGDAITIDMATGAASTQAGATALLTFAGLPDHDKRIEIWLPYGEVTELVSLRASARIDPIEADRRPVWLHHGSSISHGSNADSPTSTWPAIAALRSGTELINLGLGGNALLDPFTARTMRDTRADLLSVKIGINLVNLDLLRLRAFTPAVHGFLDTIRDGHPTTPLLVISPLYCAIHEDTPGPGAFDLEALAAGKIAFRATGEPADVRYGKLTLTTIRRELQRIVRQRAATDPHLHYLDGLELYGLEDHAELPMPDGLHPDGRAHRLIGERFATLVFGGDGVFAGTCLQAATCAILPPRNP
ncbi:MAG: lipase [Cupriavidus sp.]|nr:MAG: lipase [Cupriavidus sp.]